MKLSVSPSAILLSCLISFSVHADNSGIEDQRKSLCKLLPDGQRCEEPKVVFGEPPAGSVVEDFRYELCTAGNCIPAKAIVPGDQVPKGSEFRIHQSLTVIAKNGTKRTWKGEDSYGFEQDGKGSSYHISYEKAHRYFWIQGVFYENSTDEWVSYLSGRLYRFPDQPYIAPDGNHMFVYFRSMDNPEEPVVTVTMYSLTKNDIAQEAQFRIDHRLKQTLDLQALLDMRPFWINSTEMAMVSHISSNGRSSEGVVARIAQKDKQWSFVTETR